MFLVGVVRDPLPVQPVPDAVDLLAGDPPGAAARRRRRPAAARAATTRPRSTPTAPTPATTTRRRSCGSGYVAFTRAAHRLSVTSYLLEPAGHAVRPVGLPGASSATSCDEWGEPVEPAWLRQAGEGRPQPLRRRRPVAALAADRHRRARRALRLEAAALVRAADPARRRTPASTWSRPPGSPSGTPSSTGCSPRRGPSAAPTIAVPLPGSLSATALLRLRDDPEAFARELARPMPRPPSPAARFGTRFHAWVEARFGQQDLFDPDDLPGRGDAGIDDDADLDELIATFEAGPFADRVPHAVEAPFALVLGRPGGPRPDRRGLRRSADGGFLVVDWKTNRPSDADPLQLAIYRLAWAELRGVPLERVRAAFHYVRTGEIVEPDGPARPSGAGGHASARERPATRPRRGRRPGRPGWRRSCSPRGRSRPAAPAGRRPRSCRRAGCRRARERRRSGARWPTAGRKPVAHRITSAGQKRAVGHAHAVGLDRARTSGAARRRPSRSASRSCSRSASPVTLTTLAGGRPRRTRSSTSATAARPTSGVKSSVRQTGSRRVTQSVSAATGAISPSSCTADAPPPTTTTRRPRKRSGPG